MARDRDASGRPRQARPRDALGRPLPRGRPGVPDVPDDPSLPPAQVVSLAQRLLDEGRPFQAHEVLETRWKACPESERDLWQGLAQLAVGITHARRGNLTGAQTLIRRGRHHLELAAPVPEIDLTGIILWTDTALGELRSDDPALPPLALPREVPARADEPAGSDGDDPDPPG